MKGQDIEGILVALLKSAERTPPHTLVERTVFPSIKFAVAGRRETGLTENTKFERSTEVWSRRGNMLKNTVCVL